MTMSSEQYELFSPPQHVPWYEEIPEEEGDPDGLRYYQREAYAAAEAVLEDTRSTLVVMATGLGKTQLFSALAKHHEGRVLVIAHRDELVQQAAARLEAMTGEIVGIEKAQFRSFRERIVVASAQTISKQKRLERMRALRPPTLIIVDEAHHYVAKSYRRPLDFFPDAKLIGVTATPERGDNKALGAIFDGVCYEKHIDAGIDEGWLVPLKGVQVELESIDLTHVKSTSGDLNRKQLDDEICKSVEAIVKVCLERYPDRRGPVFFPGKASAKLACERFNAINPDCARVVTDDTDPDERAETMRAIKRGDVQYLCNVMVATEGFDWPEADIVVLGRPTKSRVVHTQMVGRGTRALPGIFATEHGGTIDDNLSAMAERKQAIAASRKSHCIVLDFVGNSGRHKLVSLVDIMSGDFSEVEVKKAKQLERDDSEPGEPRDYLEKARAELKAMAAATRSQVKANVKEFDMLTLVRFDPDASAKFNAKNGFTPATEKQKAYLEKAGIPTEDMSRRDASRAMATLIMRRQKGLATPRQLDTLRKHGWDNPNIYFKTASAMLNYCAQKGWRDITREKLETIAKAAKNESSDN